MKKLRYGAVLGLALTLYTVCSTVSVGAVSADTALAETAVAAMSEAPAVAESSVCEATETVPAISDGVAVGSRFWELFFGKKNESGPLMLCPGGDVFGVKIKSDGVTVAESHGVPALKSGDKIISINGKKVTTARDVTRELSNCGGESVTIRALHGKSEIGIEVRPTLVDGEYKLGITLREGAAGIGTVTFVDPQTGLFGGLGHGICDADSGEVVSMSTGEICEVVLGGIHRGESGKPGELCGILTDNTLGQLKCNCECGVFGTVNPEKVNTGAAIPVGSRSDVRNGEATIISTLKNGKTAEYKIEIFDIDRSSDGSKSFKIKVTDPTLTALTGGIIRGMSGSPIIQNGKLIGAVTHVLVADPTEGYGIFIENMLNAAKSEALPKAA